MYRSASPDEVLNLALISLQGPLQETSQITRSPVWALAMVVSQAKVAWGGGVVGGGHMHAAICGTYSTRERARNNLHILRRAIAYWERKSTQFQRTGIALNTTCACASTKWNSRGGQGDGLGPFNTRNWEGRLWKCNLKFEKQNCKITHVLANCRCKLRIYYICCFE